MSAQRRPATKRAATATAGTGTGTGTASRRGNGPLARPSAPGAGTGNERTSPERPGKATSARPAQGEAKRDVGQRTERVRRLYRETVAEIKRVNWPDQETTRNLTIVVIGISVVLGILLGGIDFVLLRLLELF